MDFAADLSAMYADFGEAVTVAGNPVTAIFDGGFADALGVAGTSPSLRCRSADVSAVAINAAVVRGGVTYTVKARQPIAPEWTAV